ncbi:putative reverse transcriptase domain-containing protein, partial [Tanacetum coccineum]
FIKNFSKIATSLTIFTWKSKTFDWGGEQELAFQTLKDKLCNAPVLALPNKPEDFVVYYDASGIGLGYVLMQRVAGALSRKEKVKPKRVRAMNIVLQSSIKDRILAAQKEAVDESTRLQKGLDEMIELRTDRVLYYLDRIWVPLKGDVRTLIIDEVHRSKYSVHSGADKMYYDIRDRYWWPRMKKDIAEYIRITMDFVTKLPRTSSGHDTIWVIMDRLTKSADFLPMREDYKMDRLARLYLNEIVARHGTRLDMSTAYHPQTDGQSEHTIQTLEDILKACVLDFRGSLDVHLPLAEVGEGYLIRHELVQETTKKIKQIKDRHKIAHDCHKSYADRRSVVRFGKKGKLAPRFVGPFEILEKVVSVAYRLDLLEELNGVHDTFYVLNLKKCLVNPTLKVPSDEIRVDDKLNFVEESVEILEREFKKLKQSRIAIVKYPHLFSDING